MSSLSRCVTAGDEESPATICCAYDFRLPGRLGNTVDSVIIEEAGTCPTIVFGPVRATGRSADIALPQWGHQEGVAGPAVRDEVSRGAGSTFRTLANWLTIPNDILIFTTRQMTCLKM